MECTKLRCAGYCASYRAEVSEQGPVERFACKTGDRKRRRGTFRCIRVNTSLGHSWVEWGENFLIQHSLFYAVTKHLLRSPLPPPLPCPMGPKQDEHRPKECDGDCGWCLEGQGCCLCQLLGAAVLSKFTPQETSPCAIARRACAIRRLRYSRASI